MRAAVRAVGAGLDEARDAWRGAWLPLAVAAAGQAAIFAAGRADLPAGAAQGLGWTGALLFTAALGPKLARLHGAHAGGEAGLRWGRLLATAVALAGLALVLAAALTTTTVLLLILLRPLGSIPAGPLGRLGVGFLLLLPVIAAAAAGGLLVLGRFALTLSADAVEPNARFSRGWRVSTGEPSAPGLVLLATTVAPTLLLLAAQAGLDILADDGAAPATPWPLWDALAAGGVLAGVTQFVFAPVNAGALRRLYAEGLRRERGGCDGPQVRPVQAPAPPPFTPERLAS